MVLRRIEGVEDVEVSYEAGKAVITYDPAITSPDEFIPELERMTGYGAEVVDGDIIELPHSRNVGEEEREDHGMHQHDTTATAHEHEDASSP